MSRDETARTARTARTAPTLREERRLLRSGYRLLAAVDEVGRGALAGPVTVGVVLVDLDTPSAPTGVRDSKLLLPGVREKLAPRLRRWARGHAVAHAEPEEIDAYGILGALRLAGRRALAGLDEQPDCVLLDGNHDWLSDPRPRRPLAQVEQEALFAADLARAGLGEAELEQAARAAERAAERLRLAELFVRRESALVPALTGLPVPPAVLTRIKADLRCAAVAAASVLAKVERDAIMTRRHADHPQFGWSANKGYSAPEHAQALRRHGPCPQHRRTWSLPGPRGSQTGLTPSAGWGMMDPQADVQDDTDLAGAAVPAADPSPAPGADRTR